MLADNLGFSRGINKNRQKDFEKDSMGWKMGQTVNIAIPPYTQVYTSNVFAAGGTANAVTETYVPLTVNTQKHVAMTVTSVERQLKINDFKERILKPYITTLASAIEASMIQAAILGTPNVVYSSSGVGNIPTSSLTLAQARATLQRHLAPSEPRTALISSDLQSSLVDTSKVLFNPSDELSKQYIEGYIGRTQGFEFFESQNLFTITNGSRVTGVTVSGAGQTGGTLLIGGSVQNADTFKAGQIFTIAGVYECHPLTGSTYPQLRQFVITANTTSTGTTVTVPIYPSIVPESVGFGATCSVVPAGGAAITFVGAANGSYRQNLAFQRDAFATAFVPLPKIVGTESYVSTFEGISVRVLTFGDAVNDAESTRIDVLYALPALVRPDHACRISE